MNQIRCDVAFLPCHGHYTMGPEDTVHAAAACHARAVVPVHWGAHKTRANAERVKELAKKQSFEGEVFILEQGMPS
jgi:L-ascorbate metabolism protein UlaG (beta-lactamase superfamily)